MISITTSVIDFFEKLSGEIIIYGTGNSGYWIGHYMNLCNMAYSCYVDKKVDYDDVSCNNHPILRYSDKFDLLSNNMVRIIVTPLDYNSVMYDLMEYDEKKGINAICLVPLLHSVTYVNGEKLYAMDVLLSYFRKKLLKTDKNGLPTIISNDCCAGFLYQKLGLPMISPTINVAINYEDYIKLFNNPQYYLSVKMEYAGHRKKYRYIDSTSLQVTVPCGRIDDVEVYFAHVNEKEDYIGRWNYIKNKINYDNLIFILSNRRLPFSHEVLKEFDKLEYKHFVATFRDDSGYLLSEIKNTMILCSNWNSSNWLKRVDMPTENAFDLLGWYNEVVCE